MTDEIEEPSHSERGPSTAHRWRCCPGSVRLSRGLPNTAGIEAAHGTVFHEFAAMCLEFDLDPQEFVGEPLTVEPFGKLRFDQAMADHMLFGLDLFRSFMNAPGAVTLIEKRVSLKEWIGPGEFGTADFAVIDVANNRIVCGDWKYGAGVPVHPENNDQAILYVLGVWSDYAREMFRCHILETHGDMALDAPWEDDIEVLVIIEQPRAEGGGGVWRTTMGHILSVGERIKHDAAMTEREDAPVVPGIKQCQFCPAAKHNTCKTRARFLLDLAGVDFDDLASDFAVLAEPEIPPASAFTPEERSQLLLHRSMFEKLFDDLHAAAYKDAEMGRPVPGMKLVLGRTPARKWKDEDKAEIILVEQFGEDAHVKKLLSPAQVEEKIGKRAFKDRFGKAVAYGEAKAILVPDTDKREAVRSILSDFDGLHDDDDAIV